MLLHMSLDRVKCLVAHVMLYTACIFGSSLLINTEVNKKSCKYRVAFVDERRSDYHVG